MGIIDFVFPKICIGCGIEGKYLCQNCISKAKFMQPICPYCKHPSIDGVTHINCKKKLGLDGLVSVWGYEGVIRKAILALKYKYATEIGKEISEYLFSSIQHLILPPVHTLTPVPVYWVKQNTRGFNQSIEVGGKLAEKMRLIFIPDLLMKTVQTKPQAELTGKERRENLKGTFILNENSDIPESVFVFDDVFTTGSTLFEAAKVIKRGGVKTVWGLTIAM